MESTVELALGPRIAKSPFYDATLAAKQHVMATAFQLVVTITPVQPDRRGNVAGHRSVLATSEERRE